MNPAPAIPAPVRPPASAKSEFWAGVRAIAPLHVGVAPFGLVYGVLALAKGVPPLAAMAMSSVVFAGSSQFLLAQLVGLGAPALVMISTVGLVNLRHALYSASVAPHVAHLSPRWKALLAYLLTDEAYATVIRRDQRGDASPNRHFYSLGAGFTLWAGWQLATAAGILVGKELPTSLPLDFALPLTFIAIVVPMIRSRAALLAALVAGGLALVAAGLPYKLGLMAAAVGGIGAGWLTARRTGSAP
jgi:predicted branched-subunit amino acid permease